MNEELKAVIEAVKYLGEEGKPTFLWWLLVTHIFEPIIIFGGLCLLVYQLRSAMKWVTVKIRESADHPGNGRG